MAEKNIIYFCLKSSIFLKADVLLIAGRSVETPKKNGLSAACALSIRIHRLGSTSRCADKYLKARQAIDKKLTSAEPCMQEVANALTTPKTRPSNTEGFN
jgi:hypothetical protein